LLLDEDADPLTEQQRGFLATVQRGSMRLERLVNDLLLAAQLRAGQLDIQKTNTNVVEITRQSVESARAHANQKQIDLTLAAPAHSIHVHGDPVRLAQAFDNLISNAIKFTPACGHVDVRVEGSARYAVIEVRDTGFGIAPGDQEQLFERFFRTRSATDKAIAGTGLGLSIAKAIVDAHDGSISVQSAEGSGTTFRVELPAARLPLDRSTSRDSGVVVNLGA
jgi:signal transduction histidine kinase